MSVRDDILRDTKEAMRARDKSRLGALRMLALYGEDEVRRRGVISPGGLAMIRRALHLAGVP